jgi:hypothetical protein
MVSLQLWSPVLTRAKWVKLVFFGALQPHLVRVDEDLQQFLDDKAAVFDLCLADKPGETADVGDEKQSFVLHTSSSGLTIKYTLLRREKRV